MRITVPNKNTKKIADYWGEDKLPIMACEELGELIQAISKVERLRIRDDIMPLMEEIRDVYISLSYLMMHYGIAQDEIQELINEKVNRSYDD